MLRCTSKSYLNLLRNGIINKREIRQIFDGKTKFRVSCDENKPSVGSRSAYRLEVVPVSPAESYSVPVGLWVGGVREDDSRCLGRWSRRAANKVIITIVIATLVLFFTSNPPIISKIIRDKLFSSVISLIY